MRLTAQDGLMTYFEKDDIPWKEETSRSRRKVLRVRCIGITKMTPQHWLILFVQFLKADDVYVAIVQWDAGFTRDGLDEHNGEETVYVLEGDFRDGHRSGYGPGSVIRGDAGSSHRPGTDNGVTFLVVKSVLPAEKERLQANWTRP